MASAKITVEGFVAKTPETRSVTGHTVTTVTVPVTPQRKTANGGYEDTGAAVWYTAEFWDEHGDAVAAQIVKGALVTITGNLEIKTREHNGQTYTNPVIGFAQLAVVCRRPARGQTAPEAWHVEPTPAAYIPAASYPDDTPF